ncbi:MAG: response regulator transcription factor [Candidatus Nanopelagicales bacterium]|jgi:DNA-binding NarL/FixJ family response regulator|nr:response regulator transcription factor [Candidatus Nanopelagicales bacterium]MCU0294435.1 response regulator transcription factor [Candidatus Nanopelagicales bacterium]
MITVVIADDHAVVREGLSLLVASEPDLDVVAAVDSGEAAVDAVNANRPDVVLMDLAMPGIGGVEATRLICEQGGPAVVVLTTFGESERAFAALDAGAVGYLLKDSQGSQVVAGIRSAAAGGSPLDPRVARALIDARQTPRSPEPERLTDKQKEVLDLVARGLSNRLIARQMGISEKTVKAHLTAIYAALGVTDRLQAALWATRGDG